MILSKLRRHLPLVLFLTILCLASGTGLAEGDDAAAGEAAAHAPADATRAAATTSRRTAPAVSKKTPQTAHPRLEAGAARVFVGGGAAAREATRAATAD